MRSKINMIAVGLLSFGLMACEANKNNQLQESEVAKFDIKYCSDSAISDFKSGEGHYDSGRFDLAFDAFFKASTQDCANADFFIANMYANGQVEGNTKAENLAKSQSSFKKACEKGLTTACSLLQK